MKTKFDNKSAKMKKSPKKTTGVGQPLSKWVG